MLLRTFAMMLAAAAAAQAAKLEYNMYLTGQHNIVPAAEDVADITHVSLAFMNSNKFNEENPTSFPLFTSVDAVREKFAPGTKVIIAIGGWGDTAGFSVGAKSDSSRALWARNVAQMLNVTGADGIDFDWEYPGGNGEDYKQSGTTNADKEWEIDAYPLLLAAVREAIGSDKFISAAVPGLPRDMLAFTKENIPAISASVDYFNIMKYDMMNRRDSVTKHHTGVQLSLQAVDEYINRGLSPEKMYLGFAFYTKWFKTDPSGNCTREVAVGCETVQMENPETGADLGVSGAFSWVDDVPSQLKTSFDKAMDGVVYDDVEGGSYYLDTEENIFWSWDTTDALKKKFSDVVAEKKLKGVFAWGLGEDAYEFEHLKAVNEGVREYNGNIDENGGGQDTSTEDQSEDEDSGSMACRVKNIAWMPMFAGCLSTMLTQF